MKLKTDSMLPKTVPLGTVKKEKLEGRKISYIKDENEAEPLQELWWVPSGIISVHESLVSL